MSASASSPRVVVSLVTHNESGDAVRVLNSLEGQEFRDFSVEAIDNASEDGTRSALLAFQRRGTLSMRVTPNRTNVGFTGGHNIGIEAAAAAGAEWVLVLNADVLLHPTFLARLLEAAGRPGRERVASYTGKILRAEGEELSPTTDVDSVGVWMTRSGRHFDIGAGERDRGQYDRPAEVFGVSGCAALYRVAALAEARIPTGFFDDDFFLYREDVDLAWRLRGLGWTARCEPSAVAWHRRRNLPERRAEMSPAANLHSVKNRFLLRINNAGREHVRATSLPTFVRDVLVVGGVATFERSSWPALRWLAENRSRLVEKRRAIQERRRASDRELLRWFVSSPDLARVEDPS